MRSKSDGSGAEPQSDPDTVAPLEYIFSHQTVGNTFIIQGVTGEPRGTEWRFEGIAALRLEITRRYVWQETEAGGRENDLGVLQDDLPPAEFSEARVMIESPAEGNQELILAYARRCLADAHERGEFPFIPKALEAGCIFEGNRFTGQHDIDSSRNAWAAVADATVIYTDFGETSQMHDATIKAARKERPMRFRRLFEPDEAQQFMNQFNESQA